MDSDTDGLEKIPDSKKQADKGKHPAKKVETPRGPRVRAIWGISYIKRKLKDRKSKYEKEEPGDKAARRTATATWWIAGFTIVLAVVSAITLYEVWQGGADTAKLAQAAVDQVDTLKSIQRAYVTFGQNLTVIPEFESGGSGKVKNWQIRPRLENSGTTPTRQAIHHVTYFYQPTPIMQPFPIGIDIINPKDPVSPDTPFVLGPKESVTGSSAAT